MLRDRRKDSGPMAYIRPIYLRNHRSCLVVIVVILSRSCPTKCTRVHAFETDREVSFQHEDFQVEISLSFRDYFVSIRGKDFIKNFIKILFHLKQL